jgi:hypothetical protein
MSKVQIGLVVSVVINAVLLFIILSPSKDLTNNDTTTNILQQQNTVKRAQIDSLKGLIDIRNKQLDSASKVKPKIKTVLITRYEKINTMPDSSVFMSVDSVLNNYSSIIE